MNGDIFVSIMQKGLFKFLKQTGPFWNFINPIVFTGVFTIIFGKIAKLPTDGTPPFLFYLTSMVFGHYLIHLYQIMWTIFRPIMQCIKMLIFQGS